MTQNLKLVEKPRIEVNICIDYLSISGNIYILYTTQFIPYFIPSGNPDISVFIIWDQVSEFKGSSSLTAAWLCAKERKMSLSGLSFF